MRRYWCPSASAEARFDHTQDTVKIGLIVSMTGARASTARELKAAVDLFIDWIDITFAGT